MKAMTFYKKYKYLIISAVMIIGALLFNGMKNVKAENSYPFQSRGKLVVNNDGVDTVIFDADDFKYLYDLAKAPYVPSEE